MVDPSLDRIKKGNEKFWKSVNFNIGVYRKNNWYPFPFMATAKALHYIPLLNFSVKKVKKIVGLSRKQSVR